VNTRSVEARTSLTQRVVVGGSIFGDDYLDLSKHADGEFVLLMCKGLSVLAVSLNKKQLRELSVACRRMAAHKSDEEVSRG
jgi:hypothetical protein